MWMLKALYSIYLNKQWSTFHSVNHNSEWSVNGLIISIEICEGREKIGHISEVA